MRMAGLGADKKIFAGACPQTRISCAYASVEPLAIEHPTVDVASREEVVQALQSMSEADLLRLKQLAKLRCAGLHVMDWEDLLNEAVTRVLAGSRRWPRQVPFVAFMAQTFRSIANEEWRRLELANTTSESDLSDSDGAPVLESAAVDPIHPGREMLARKALEEIEALFHDDPSAMAILQGFAQGYTPDEIMGQNGLSSTQYATLQRRIRRKLSKHFS